MSAWPIAALREISRTQGKYGANLPSKSWVPGSPRYVRITDIDWDGKLGHDIVGVTDDPAKWESYRLRDGDLLFARSGATVGKTYLHPSSADPAIYAGYLIKFELDTKLALPAYVFRYTQTRQYREWVAASSRAVAQPNINAQQYGRLPVPLPPLADQHRIAAILDRADAVRKKRREALSRLEALTQAIFFDMFGDPISNPDRWPAVSLNEIGHLYSGGTPTKNIAENWRGDLPWFSPKDLKTLELRDSIDHISADVPRRSSLRVLPVDTVVFVVRGMILAHSFPVSITRVPATINQDMKAVIPGRDIDPWYLAYCLRAQSRHALNQVSTAAHGTKRLDREGIANIRIPLPGKRLQTEFSDRIATIGAINNIQAQHSCDLDKLFASLQSIAFAGEL